MMYRKRCDAMPHREMGMECSAECFEPVVDVWLAGQYLDPDDVAGRWQVIGVFSTQDRAVESCLDPVTFIGPLPIDHDLGRRPGKWAGAYYPMAAT